MKPGVGGTRRDFLSLGVASAAGAGLAAPSLFGSNALDETGNKQSAQPEYMLEPGITYLNTGSLGPTPRAVFERTVQAWKELETNPVRMSYGQGAVLVETDRVRERAATFLGCAIEELLITHSTTDAMNSVGLGMRLKSGDRVLTTDQEHEGGSVCWTYLARRQGIGIDKIPIAPTDQDMTAIVQRFAAAITPETRVISVSHVITTTGLRMPIEQIAALARERGILCVVDGAQAVGQIAVNVKTLGCHAYAGSGHKWLMGPKGTGLLYISQDAAKFIEPIQREHGIRCVEGSTGVSSLPLIVGLGTAIELLTTQGMAAVESRVITLRNRVYAGLLKLPKIQVVSVPPGPLASAMVTFRLPDEFESRKFQMGLHDKYNIVTKMVEKQWFNGIRISTHVFNTEEDVDRVLKALKVELG